MDFRLDPDIFRVFPDVIFKKVIFEVTARAGIE